VPPNPGLIARAQETLGFRPNAISAFYRYLCLHPRLPNLQHSFRFTFFDQGALSYHQNIDPKLRYCAYRQLFSAQGFLVSQLLRTVQMIAASKPTSSLSSKPHLLSTECNFGTLAVRLGCFPFVNEAYPPLTYCQLTMWYSKFDRSW